MSMKGAATKEKLMNIAENRFLESGFSATSIESLITEAGITKGGFFYHFKGKNDLAYSLLERYRKEDALLFSKLFGRAGELSDDPLQQMLIFVKLLSELMSDMEDLHPGCLVASVTYESKQVNEQVKAITTDIVLDWREIFKKQIEKIEQIYESKSSSSSEDLADMLTIILEGGIVVSRALNDKKILIKQLLEYRSYLQLIYS